jgi:pantetheine-phosphate adenylyltransferase
MSKIAVYPGTFDPITMGHIDLATRAASIFDHLIVAVVDTSGVNKKTLFTTEERVELAQTCFAAHPNIEVIAFKGLLARFAESQGAQIVIRGLRAVSDYEYETQLAGMNRHLVEGLETLFMTSDHRYHFISSSLVKDVAKHDGDTGRFLHPTVKKALMTRLKEIYK